MNTLECCKRGFWSIKKKIKMKPTTINKKNTGIIKFSIEWIYWSLNTSIKQHYVFITNTYYRWSLTWYFVLQRKYITSLKSQIKAMARNTQYVKKDEQLFRHNKFYMFMERNKLCLYLPCETITSRGVKLRKVVH